MSKPRWISVAECPPKEDGDSYWVYLPPDDGVVGPVLASGGNWLFEYLATPMTGSGVTHYMPYYTPEPPEGNEAE